MKLDLLAFAHHPIQYQAPIFRLLARQLGDQFHVHFKDGQMGQGAVDPGFGIKVTWDSGVLSGYSHSFRDDAPSVLGLLRKRRPTAVLLFVGYNDPWALEIIAACKFLGIPILWRFEGSDGGHRPAWKAIGRDVFLRQIYGSISAFLSIGTRCTEHLRRLGVPQEKIFHSPYNIDDQLFEPLVQRAPKEREDVRTELGLRPEDFAFVFCGKLIPRKDPLIILDALEQSSIRDQAAVIFIGTGELMEQVTARARALLGHRAVMAGFANQSQLGRYYAAGDAAILPSRRETWGLVVNEALIFGLPVVVAETVECHPDLVTPFETGFVFPTGKARALAEHMEYLATRRDEAARMGAAARERAKAYTAGAATHGIVKAMEFVSHRRAAG